MNRRHFTLATALAALAPTVGTESARATGLSEGSGAAVTGRLDSAANAIRSADSVQTALDGWGTIAAEVLPFVHMTALVAKGPASTAAGDSAGDVRRIFSTVPAAYPVGGWKHLSGSEWASHVLQQQKVLVASGNNALARYFPDHALLRSLGTRTLINLPVVVCRRTVGAFAMLCAQEEIGLEAISAIQRLVPCAAAVFVMAGEHAA
ncbi:hypothetical protein [Cupriavidus necator]|uniref:hypothetical protein n=1 Tax=Cupriavidus necator TaxID=106590 RepID=UPI00339D899D